MLSPPLQDTRSEAPDHQSSAPPSRGPRQGCGPAGCGDCQLRARPAASPWHQAGSVPASSRNITAATGLARTHQLQPARRVWATASVLQTPKSYVDSAPNPAPQPQAFCFSSSFCKLNRGSFGNKFLPPAQVLGGERPQESGPAWPS